MLNQRVFFRNPMRSCVFAALALSVVTSLLATETAQPKKGRVVPIIDTHAHIMRGAGTSPEALAADALRYMDELGLEMTVLLPPPFPPRPNNTYDRAVVEPLARKYPGRFAFAAGGGSLNQLIQRYAPDNVPADVIQRFRQTAETLVEAGTAAFGEITTEHFSFAPNHPYESTRPDHPLLLELADISAQHGIPIDLHMEAVSKDMPFPSRVSRSPNNPSQVKENISAFERLLAHNRQARIVWAHAGWDVTGERSVALMRALLTKHSNLYMSIKIELSGPHRSSLLGPGDSINRDWLELLQSFPDRFMVGSDQFYEENRERLIGVRKFVDALPAEIAGPIASGNAKRIYRLGEHVR